MVLDDPFTRFLKIFSPDAGVGGPAHNWNDADTLRFVGARVPLYTAFLRSVARQSYRGGLIRFLLPDLRPSLAEWNAQGGWRADWPLWASHLRVFAYDWLGRQIAFDFRRNIGGEPAVSILEPGTGQLLEVPEGFGGFIESEITNHTDAALASNFFAEWRSTGGAAPQPDQCVGYKRPLFLGGQDVVSNLALTDMAVYVSLMGQTFEQVRQLPTGKRISGVRRVD